MSKYLKQSSGPTSTSPYDRLLLSTPTKSSRPGSALQRATTLLQRSPGEVPAATVSVYQRSVGGGSAHGSVHGSVHGSGRGRHALRAVASPASSASSPPQSGLSLNAGLRAPAPSAPRAGAGGAGTAVRNAMARAAAQDASGTSSIIISSSSASAASNGLIRSALPSEHTSSISLAESELPSDSSILETHHPMLADKIRKQRENLAKTGAQVATGSSASPKPKAAVDDLSSFLRELDQAGKTTAKSPQPGEPPSMIQKPSQFSISMSSVSGSASFAASEDVVDIGPPLTAPKPLASQPEIAKGAPEKSSTTGLAKDLAGPQQVQLTAGVPGLNRPPPAMPPRSAESASSIDEEVPSAASSVPEEFDESYDKDEGKTKSNVSAVSVHSESEKIESESDSEKEHISIVENVASASQKTATSPATTKETAGETSGYDDDFEELSESDESEPELAADVSEMVDQRPSGISEQAVKPVLPKPEPNVIAERVPEKSVARTTTPSVSEAVTEAISESVSEGSETSALAPRQTASSIDRASTEDHSQVEFKPALPTVSSSKPDLQMSSSSKSSTNLRRSSGSVHSLHGIVPTPPTPAPPPRIASSLRLSKYSLTSLHEEEQQERSATDKEREGSRSGSPMSADTSIGSPKPHDDHPPPPPQEAYVSSFETGDESIPESASKSSSPAKFERRPSPLLEKPLPKTQARPARLAEPDVVPILSTASEKRLSMDKTPIVKPLDRLRPKSLSIVTRKIADIPPDPSAKRPTIVNRDDGPHKNFRHPEPPRNQDYRSAPTWGASTLPSGPMLCERCRQPSTAYTYVYGLPPPPPPPISVPQNGHLYGHTRWPQTSTVVYEQPPAPAFSDPQIQLPDLAQLLATLSDQEAKCQHQIACPKCNPEKSPDSDRSRMTRSLLRGQVQVLQHLLHVSRQAQLPLAPAAEYTTLEATKAYIASQRRPPLTFEDALRQVQEEQD